MTAEGERDLIRAQKRYETARTNCINRRQERDQMLDRITGHGAAVTIDRAKEITGIKSDQGIANAKKRSREPQVHP